MKKLVLSLTLGSMVAIAFAPNALAARRQLDSPSEAGSLTEFIRTNRDARSKN